MNVPRPRPAGRAVAARCGLLVVLAAVLSACDSCGSKHAETPSASKSAAKQEQAAAAEKEPAFGTVEGVVRLAEGKDLPVRPEGYATIRPGKEPKRPPDVCPPPKKSDRRPVELADERALTNVLVAASEFEAKIEREAKTHEVVIAGCQLRPQLVVAVKDDTLVVENQTDYPFLPRFPTDAFYQSLNKGDRRSMKLDRGGMFPLVCGFAAPCGRADVMVLYHPVYDVTNDEGRFRIDNVPAGEPVRLDAWHPLFASTGTTVELKPDETEKIELVIEPAPSKPDDAEASPDGSVPGPI